MHYHSTTVFQNVNNYDYSPERVAEVRRFLDNDEYPDRLKKQCQRKAFKDRWRNFEWKNNHLWFKPLDLEVITDDNEKLEKLKALYTDMKTGVGAGQKQFYYIVVQHYLNIKRREVDAFLKKQKVF